MKRKNVKNNVENKFRSILHGVGHFSCSTGSQEKVLHHRGAILDNENTNGITLIALIITIIIMLILAGIVLSLTIGDNGIFKTAKNAARNYADAAQDESNQINEFGNLIQDELNEDKNKEEKIQIKVGDYVDYEPTKTDVNKTTEVSTSLLTYTSQKGGYSSTAGRITHGNGDSNQTFTAKANDGTTDGLRWRVLSISSDKIELVSENVIKTDNDTNFTLNGGIGYLYAEQELNEVCKIYGYGYGADTTTGAKYEIGGPFDLEEGRIEGTGARSIKAEDINKIANITEKDFVELDSKYGSEITEALYYPTLSSNNTNKPGQSATKKSGLKYMRYAYFKSKIKDTKIQDMLFIDNTIYWIASRSTDNLWTPLAYTVGNVGGSGLYDEEYGYEEGYLDYMGFCCAYSDSLEGWACSDNAVRPVVTLKANVIDTTNITKEIGTKENPWKLK